MPASVDVVVIGGGVAGVSVAWHARKLGLGVALLESELVASRASGRNDGQVLLGLGEHLNRLVGQLGRESALELWRFLDENHNALSSTLSAEGIDCDFVQEGGLRLASSESELDELRESSQIMRAEGIAHRLLEADEVEAALPLSRGFFGALYLEREAIFDPAAFVEGLALRARAGGALIREQCRVVEVEGELGAYRVRSDDLELEAAVVVHATSALAPQLERSGFLSRVVFPFRGQIIATRELSDEQLAAMPRYAMSSHFCYEYFRVHGKRMTLGGMRWSVKGEESGILDDESVNPEVTHNLVRYLEKHFPSLSTIGVHSEWTGIMAGSPDALPLVGEVPGRPGEYACLAFNGYGMSFAFLAGKCIAEMIQSGRSSYEAASQFRPSRF